MSEPRHEETPSGPVQLGTVLEAGPIVCGICDEPFTIPAEEGGEEGEDQDLDGE